MPELVYDAKSFHKKHVKYYAHNEVRVEEGRNSVYGIARKLQKTVLAVMFQTHAEKLYAKILL